MSRIKNRGTVEDRTRNEAIPGLAMGLDLADTLSGLAKLARILDEVTTAIIAERRQAGESWADIGRSLGVSKQAAQQRYGKAVDRDAFAVDGLPSGVLGVS